MSASKDARISTALPSHPKTKKLQRSLGYQGVWHLILLLLWTTENRSDGDLSGMADDDIELAIDWPGEVGALVSQLALVGFIDGGEGARRIHDWADHNPWAAGAKERSLKAQWNAAKRYHGEAGADRLVPDYRAGRTAASSAGSSDRSIAASSPPALQLVPCSTAPSPSPYPSPYPKAEKLFERQAARFDEFWSTYPNRKGKKAALAKWKALGLDRIADRIIADVQARKTSDRDWLDGYAPHGSKYINGAGWEDDIVTSRQRSPAAHDAFAVAE